MDFCLGQGLNWEENTMTDREKLVDLLKNHDNIELNCFANCRTCTLRMGYDCVEELLADYLIANGVVIKKNQGGNDEQR